jgi:hypothetical protein
MIIPKGSYPALRDAGLDSLQRTIAELVPWLAERVGHRDWPTRITQTAVGLLQDHMLARALRWQAGPPPAVAVLLRVQLGVPRLADLPLRVAAFGLRPEHVSSTAQAAAQVRDCRDP